VATRVGVELTVPQLHALVRYLVGVRTVLHQAVEARRVFVREVGVLFEQARSGNGPAAAQATGRVGREQVGRFREARLAVQRLSPPAAGEQCHEAVAGWIEMHVAACEVMVEVGGSGDLGRLREAQNLLAEGRQFASRFNVEYGRLTGAVRTRTDELRASRREISARARTRDDRPTSGDDPGLARSRTKA
jgi:hypothetical protein